MRTLAWIVLIVAVMLFAASEFKQHLQLQMAQRIGGK